MANGDISQAGFDAQINVKMSRDLRDRLRKIEAKHGTPVSEILRRLGAAAVVFFEKNGYLTFPASIMPEIFSLPAPRQTGVRQKTAGSSKLHRKHA